jgi:hypothetical protein
MSLYLHNLRGKNLDLTVACCVETLRVGSFTHKTVGVHQLRLVGLMNRGIINRVPGTRNPFEYVAPAATIDWYHKHIDER